MTGPTCGCRGCNQAFKEGYAAAEADYQARLKESNRAEYRRGYNDGVRVKAVGDWLYGSRT